MITTKQQEHLSIYANYLRDIADKDYIAARNMYWLGLSENFLWLGLQAVEKYFKCIMLYNGLSAKDYSHQTIKIHDKIQDEIKILFKLDQKELDLLARLEAGADRYYLKNKAVIREDLILFDSAVWKIRRFCQDLNVIVEPKSLQPKTILSLNEIDMNKPHMFKLMYGYLEQVLKMSNSRIYRKQAKALIYKNPMYGKRKKNKLKNYGLVLAFRNPPYANDLESREWIKNFVRL